MVENQMSFDKLKNIFERLNTNIIITADPKDWEMARNLENDNVKFIQTNNFLEWAGVIKNAKLFITLEGGAMHIAPALGIKTIALFGKSNINKWYPWGYKDLVIQDKTKIAENIEVKKIIEKIKDNI
jgi:ADP-heptose:LPS heptosyltransferase